MSRTIAWVGERANINSKYNGLCGLKDTYELPSLMRMMKQDGLREFTFMYPILAAKMENHP